MTPELSGLLTVVGVVVVAALYALSRRPSDSAGDERGLPAALRGARLAYAEETFRSAARRLVARLDRAYEVDGKLVLVEFKTRRANVAYMADVIELSVQRVALQDERRVPVSKTAWVVTQNSDTGTRQPHRVTLLSTAEVEALRSRYLEIEAGVGRAPSPASSDNQCLHCGHRAVCIGRKAGNRLN
jgi:PD-(D/E)XK nuclease superfamily